MEPQMRSVRGPRGIQIEDVWAAADVILNRGERPTIERIRHQLGRGSPNTVGPMLDNWYATLAARLTPNAGGGQSVSPDHAGVGLAGDDDACGLPRQVLRAATALWGRARHLAEEAAHAAYAARQSALDAEAATLAAGKEEFETEKQRFSDRAAALESALLAKDRQISQLERQLEELRHMLLAKTGEAEHLRSDLSKQRIAMDAMRQFTQAKDEEHRKERERIEQRSTAQERRLLAEIDRARQSAKAAEAALDTHEQQSARRLAESEERRAQSEEKQTILQQENAVLLKNLLSAQQALEQFRSPPQEITQPLSPARASRLRAKAPEIPRRTRLKRHE